MKMVQIMTARFDSEYSFENKEWPIKKSIEFKEAKGRNTKVTIYFENLNFNNTWIIKVLKDQRNIILFFSSSISKY